MEMVTLEMSQLERSWLNAFAQRKQWALLPGTIKSSNHKDTWDHQVVKSKNRDNKEKWSTPLGPGRDPDDHVEGAHGRDVLVELVVGVEGGVP
jgi:hypothetical protein